MDATTTRLRRQAMQDQLERAKAEYRDHWLRVVATDLALEDAAREHRRALEAAGRANERLSAADDRVRDLLKQLRAMPR